jgi:hypothetical protein
MGVVLGALLASSLFLARIPALYYSYPRLNDYSGASVCSYDNASLLVVLMIVPIASYTSYWAIGYMLFRREFTASPGK